MNGARQFAEVLRMNVLSHGQRPGMALTIVVGVTCAVGVLVAMLAMGAGARIQTLSDIRMDRAIVIAKGAQSTAQSSIPKDVGEAVLVAQGIRKSRDGQPVAVREALVMIEARRQADDARISFPLWGVSPGLTELRPELHVTAGRWFRPGVHEIAASEVCAGQYKGFGIGEKRSLRGGDWSVVGHFITGHSGGTCTLYADADSVMSAFTLDSVNQVVVMLSSPQNFDAFQATLSADPHLQVEVRRERDVVMQESQRVTGILDFASYFVGAIMALGATLGAANSLYAIVDSRRRELATLRAIGFGSAPIVIAIIVESILLALPGALVGAGLAGVFFNGLSASPRGVSFQLTVTPEVIALGIVWALAMGLVGGLAPALRAARLPIIDGLRAT